MRRDRAHLGGRGVGGRLGGGRLGERGGEPLHELRLEALGLQAAALELGLELVNLHRAGVHHAGQWGWRQECADWRLEVLGDDTSGIGLAGINVNLLKDSSGARPPRGGRRARW